MYRKKSNDYPCKRGILSHAMKFLACVLLAFGMAACSDDDEPVVPEPEPEPEPTEFRVHIGEGNIIDIDEENLYPDHYPIMKGAFMVMEDLPADEKILYMGGCYSPVSQEPDFTDYYEIYDYSNYPDIQEWDWTANPQLIWQCMYFLHMVPGTTSYLRGYVETDKGAYWSNTMEVHSNFMEPLQEDPNAYEIPVVFHLFPDEDGTYPVQDYFALEQIEYANHVYSNYYQIPGQPGYFNIPAQVKTGVRFVPATEMPDGTPLETPGIYHEQEPINFNYGDDESLDRKYVWDMEKVLNVWVCRIGGTETEDGSVFGGYTAMPFFDEGEVLPGCDTYEPGTFTGIFLNVDGMQVANQVMTFAHEAGHFLGLNHVFATESQENDYCDDTPWYDRGPYNERLLEGYMPLNRWVDGTDERFISDNIMDYDYGYMTGFTPDQVERIQYTLEHAYFIPGEAGKEEVQGRSAGQKLRFGKPVR